MHVLLQAKAVGGGVGIVDMGSKLTMTRSLLANCTAIATTISAAVSHATLS